MTMYAPPDQYVPQLELDRRPVLMWSIVALGAMLLIALIAGAPLALASGHKLLGHTIFQAFGHVCHQIPERSFFIAGHQFAVCARCTGLYAGFAGAVLAYPVLRSLKRTGTPARKWLFIAAAPLALDFTLGFLGLWDNTHFSRFSTGALLGAVAVFYVMPGLVELSFRAGRFLSRNAVGEGAKEIVAEGFSERLSVAPSDYSAPHR